MVHAGGRECEEHPVAGCVLADPSDELYGRAQGDSGASNRGSEPGDAQTLRTRLGNGTSDDDDHRESLAVLRRVTGTASHEAGCKVICKGRDSTIGGRGPRHRPSLVPASP
jgi:hypothetical protein